ncbi:MAG TPA: HipA domain-containing protein [Streptosporangiaceae bacterium]|nr:HipA domain-containing protein [Streptosporangiaceae bacterium]
MTSQPDSSSFGVWIGDRRAGTIRRFGDRTRFSLDSDYREDPDRPVLGLVFEDRPDRVHVATVRLAPWFSNLLPEGRLRDWIAVERGVNSQREMQLLAQVGHDLPGAVRVLPEDEVPIEALWGDEPDTYTIELTDDFHRPSLRFSLAGVGMKFSMLRRGDRLTMPAHGEGGDWIVKTPDTRFHDVPLNEFAMMTLANASGIDVPEIMLLPRERVDERLPSSVWPEDEEFAYAIRRFDRDEHRGRVHIEDLAQVRNVYPELKYKGNFETVANLIYRGHDTESLLEFARRLTFSVLISNGDYHLKNWSLIYRDERAPALSPAYDLVSTAFYFAGERVEDLGLKFGGSKDFHRVTLATFRRLQERLGARHVKLTEFVAATVERTVAEWPRNASILDSRPRLQEAVDQSIRMRSKTIMRNRA